MCRLNLRPRACVSTKNKIVNISGEDELPLKGAWGLCETQDKEVFLERLSVELLCIETSQASD